jgi:hypothetical protein
VDLAILLSGAEHLDCCLEVAGSELVVPAAVVDDGQFSLQERQPAGRADGCAAIVCPHRSPVIAAQREQIAALVALRAAAIFRRRLGGYTGDCLGATQQAAELAIYLGILASWSFT